MFFASCVEALPLVDDPWLWRYMQTKNSSKVTFTFSSSLFSTLIPNWYQINTIAFFKVKSEQEISLPLSELSAK